MAYRFARARGFAEISAEKSALAKIGPLTWLQSHSFIQDADTKLQLGGQLMGFFTAHGVSWEPIPVMSEQEWDAFLSRTAGSEVWQSFSERTSSGIRYTILVLYEEFDLPTNAVEEREPRDGGNSERNDA